MNKVSNYYLYPQLCDTNFLPFHFVSYRYALNFKATYFIMATHLARRLFFCYSRALYEIDSISWTPCSENPQNASALFPLSSFNPSSPSSYWSSSSLYGSASLYAWPRLVSCLLTYSLNHFKSNIIRSLF